MTCNTPEHFYPIKHEIVNILMTVHQKLPCSLSQSIAKHQLTLKRQCTFVRTAIVPIQPHTLLEVSHMKHCVILPAYTKLQEWPMHDDTKHYHKLQNHVYTWNINLWDSIHKLTEELFKYYEIQHNIFLTPNPKTIFKSKHKSEFIIYTNIYRLWNHHLLFMLTDAPVQSW
jgi:hypothetical protein